jgi:hypothetical protein
VIAVVEGSIRFGLPDEDRGMDLEEGDRLELPAGTRHDALVGPRGVTCLEAHLPARSVARLTHRTASAWHDETDGHDIA